MRRKHCRSCGSKTSDGNGLWLCLATGLMLAGLHLPGALLAETTETRGESKQAVSELQKPGKQPDAQLRSMRGQRYRLEQGQPIFAGPLVLEVVARRGGPDLLLWQQSMQAARQSVPSGTKQSSLPAEKQPRSPSKPAATTAANGHRPQAVGSIRGLVFKSGEYIYGRLQLDGQSQSYRCKLWQRGRLLYPRVYDTYTYYTFALTVDT